MLIEKGLKVANTMNAQEFNKKLLGIETKLYHYAYSLLGNKEDAKDLLQETFFKALVNRNKFEANVNLTGWVFTIMRNTFINSYNKQKQASLVFDQSKDLFSLNVESYSNMNPDNNIFFQELEKEILQVEEDKRIPFEMYNAGYKYKEIAEQLDTSIGTIKNRIYICRKKLMDTLHDFQN